MNVDFPQPESAATPMRMGFSPSFKAICKLEVLCTETELLGMKAEGVKADTVVAQANAIESFMLMTSY
jgi:hypothetical protein